MYSLYQIKDEGLKPGEPIEEVGAEDKPKKIKTRGEVNTVNGSDWSQEQQRALEAALTKYPKGASIDRWEKIANCVEGKTKVYQIFSFLIPRLFISVFFGNFVMFIFFTGGMPNALQTIGGISKKEATNTVVLFEYILKKRFDCLVHF